MRSTWDALARADPGIYVGDPARALAELHDAAAECERLGVAHLADRAHGLMPV